MSYICQKQENSNAKWHNKEQTQKRKSLAIYRLHYIQLPKHMLLQQHHSETYDNQK